MLEMAQVTVKKEKAAEKLSHIILDEARARRATLQDDDPLLDQRKVWADEEVSECVKDVLLKKKMTEASIKALNVAQATLKWSHLALAESISQRNILDYVKPDEPIRCTINTNHADSPRTEPAEEPMRVEPIDSPRTKPAEESMRTNHVAPPVSPDIEIVKTLWCQYWCQFWYQFWYQSQLGL